MESTSTFKLSLPCIYPQQKYFWSLSLLSCVELHGAIQRRHCIEYHAADKLLTVTKQQVNTSWPPPPLNQLATRNKNF